MFRTDRKLCRSPWLTLGNPKTTSREALTELVVGAQVTSPKRTNAPRRGRSRLYVADLSCRRDDGFEAVRDARFHVRDGEIYGIAGVSGNGQQELVEVLMGLRPAASGAADMAGFGDLTNLPANARAGGSIAAIPADRYTLGLAASLSVEDNYGIGQVRTGRFGGWAWVDRGAMRHAAKEAIARHDIHGVRSMSQPAALLSGGNAQKLVLARELETTPALVIAHNPSRGLDVRACAAVHRHLLDASDSGAAVLLLSEDLEEVLALSDRIGVMSRGAIVAEFEPPFDRLRIGEAMVADHGR